MRALLSKGSIKMAEDQAKAQNIPVDEAILRETLFSPDMKTLKFRNEKIDGDNASIEVENPFGSFDRIPFIREDGIWKIAKEKYAEEMIKQAEEDEKKLQETINEGKIPVETPQNWLQLLAESLAKHNRTRTEDTERQLPFTNNRPPTYKCQK